MPEVSEEVYVDEVYVDSDAVVCDGGGGALGHPRVYLAIDHTGRAECPYCSRRFIYRPADQDGQAAEHRAAEDGPGPTA